MSSNANSRIGIIKETTPGTTPSTPVLESQRFSSANFSMTRAELIDDSKADTRQYLYTQTGNKTVGGSLDGAFAYDNYEALLESAFYNTFVTDELTMGDTIQSMTVEIAQPDASTPIYQINRGVIVNGFSLSSPVDGLTTISFDMLGLEQEIATSSVSASSYNAQTSSVPFLHCSGTISEGGSPIAIVTDLSLDLTNNLETVHTWGDCDPYTLTPARIDVTGNLTAILDDESLLTKFNNDTQTSLEFTLVDNDGNSYTFELPNVKFTSADAPIDTGSGLRTISLPFRALMDSVSQSTVIVTRQDAP